MCRSGGLDVVIVLSYCVCRSGGLGVVTVLSYCVFRSGWVGVVTVLSYCVCRSWGLGVVTIVSFVCAECQAAASVDAAGETDAGSTAALTVPGLQRHPAPH